MIRKGNGDETGGRLFPLLVTTALLMGGCLMTSPRERAHQVAQQGMDQSEVIEAGFFDLFSYHRFSAPGQPLTLYIEGDGMAWLNRHQLSEDPTPRDPLTLRMAVTDRADNVAYLGRPCQYVTQQHRRNCAKTYWSTERFSEPVIDATHRAIDHLKRQARASSLHLVGFSGGGAVAVLVAARRTDVASIRTVAGNLDHEAFSRLHETTPLSGSLNPMDVRKAVKTIPQLHFVGGRDRIVPPSIAEGYLAGLDQPLCARIVRVESMEHGGEWPSIWPTLLQTPYPRCSSATE